MNPVDAAKRARARAVDRLCPQGIVFHHVPKCGGTSVGRAIRRSYVASQATILPGPSRAAAVTVDTGGDAEMATLRLREGMLAYHLHAGVRAVAAHVPYSTTVHDEFGDRYRFVTVLRDPIERFVSHHRFSHADPSRHGYIARPLEEFVATREARTLGTALVRFLCGRPMPGAELEGRGVALAVANLARLDAVGTTDAMAAFEADLRRLTGKRISIGHENAGAGAAPLDPEVRARIEEICAPDLEVWNAARALAPSPTP